MASRRAILRLATLATLLGSKTMPAQSSPPAPAFEKMTAATPADRIRLLRDGDGVRLFLARSLEPDASQGPFVTVLSALRLDGPDAPPAREHLRVARLLPGVVDWDVAIDAATRTVPTVLDDFGGATSSLDLDRNGQSIALTEFASAHDFKNPRFCAGANAIAVTSVVDEKRVVLLLPAGAAGALATSITLHQCPPDEVIDGARLLHTAQGPCLIYKRYDIGPRRGAFPGTLCAVRLDRHHAAAGPVFHPLGKRTVFEFDADTTPDGLALVATTANGFILATGPTTQALSQHEFAHVPELHQPCVSRGTRDVQLAFQEVQPTGRTGVVVARWPLAAAG